MRRADTHTQTLTQQANVQNMGGKQTGQACTHIHKLNEHIHGGEASTQDRRAHRTDVHKEQTCMQDRRAHALEGSPHGREKELARTHIPPQLSMCCGGAFTL